MNLYIHQENQQLLWNTISKTSLFSSSSREHRNIWFKNIIQYFYERNPHVYDTSSLQKINRETISYMVEQLKNGINIPTNPLFAKISTPDSIPNINSYQYPDYMGKEAEKARKQEVFNSAFEERQRQFESLFAKPTPPTDVTFSEKMDDHPISNMEELLEKHKRERDAEINKYSPINSFLPEQNDVLYIKSPVIQENTIKNPVSNPIVNPLEDVLINYKQKMDDFLNKYDNLFGELFKKYESKLTNFGSPTNDNIENKITIKETIENDINIIQDNSNNELT
jgi:hypothetical protein